MNEDKVLTKEQLKRLVTGVMALIAEDPAKALDFLMHGQEDIDQLVARVAEDCAHCNSKTCKRRQTPQAETPQEPNNPAEEEGFRFDIPPELKRRLDD